MSSQDRCRGVLIGLAAGDRIGGPIRMAVRLAESLSECNDFVRSDVLNRYLDWWKEGAFDTGPVSDRALILLARGMSVGDAARQVHAELSGMTAGCNPAHRSSPLSMLVNLTDDELSKAAISEAALTHFDPIAGEIAVRVNQLCRRLIRGECWEQSLRTLSPCLDLTDPGRNGGFAPNVFQAAVYFVNRSSSFTETLDRSLEFAGPANYCPVLAGVIAGARWGGVAIPANSLGHVEILPRVKSAAEILASGWISD
jgi:ADP-ribosyl-[dinitrogen reductase] hydrolase